MSNTRELKPYRQTWLHPDTVHHEDTLVELHDRDTDGKQWVQLYTISNNGVRNPITCILNRDQRTAIDVQRIDGKWHFIYDENEQIVKQSDKYEDAIEAAYWMFDDIKSKNKGQSERDSFKQAVRQMLNSYKF